MGERHVVINICTPEKWTARHFWVGRQGRRTFGLVLAFCPTVFAIGVEALTGFGKGVAIIIGPLWIGFATAPLGDPAHD